LDERGGVTQETLFVGIENGDQTDFGQVNPLAEEIDANQTVKVAQAKVIEDIGTVEGQDVGVEVLDLEAGDVGEEGL